MTESDSSRTERVVFCCDAHLNTICCYTRPAIVGPATRAAETGCEQRITLRDHIVEGHPTIGSDYVVFCGESAATAVTCRRCLGRLLPFCHRHVRFDRVCYESILMCSVLHIIEFFCTGSSVAAPCDLRA